MSQAFSAFHNHTLLASGSLDNVARACRKAERDGLHGVLMFDNETGKQTDIPLENPVVVPEHTRGRGRPALGVTAREVTLLPRHWEWLATQPGGASTTLRKLVEAARRDPKAEAKRKQERAYHFLSAIAGDLPHYEDTLRALFAGDVPRVTELTATWPPDLRAHALNLLQA